jgi:glycosyltransferase involved in cell wall biosynthesis
MSKPTLHCLAMPHTQVTREYGICAYTQRVRKFCSMMHDQGYRVILYAGDENEARCDELVTILSARKQRELLKRESWWRDGEIYALPYSEAEPIWDAYNTRAIKQIAKRIEPRDLICLASGTHAPVMRAFPEHLSTEVCVGYEGVVSNHRVFESRAWAATVYGWQQGAAAADGRFFDAVIPPNFELEDFPAGDGGAGYFLFLSRMTPRKGYEIAIEATRRAGAQLWIAGVGGDHPEAEHVSYVGLVDTKKRAALLGGARALFCPTLYLEPFGNVVVEAALCGTPAITTDWGSFPELVEQGVTGYRCRSLGEFAWATEHAGELDRGLIRERAISRYSTAAVGPMFSHYFEHLGTLFGNGWYDATPKEPKW